MCFKCMEWDKNGLIVAVDWRTLKVRKNEHKAFGIVVVL